jgi:hypothetical protein
MFKKKQMRKTEINMIQNFTEFYWIISNFTNFMDFETVLLWTTKQLTCGLADKCNKDQLKECQPEDGLIKRPKHVVVNKQRNKI